MRVHELAKAVQLESKDQKAREQIEASHRAAKDEARKQEEARTELKPLLELKEIHSSEWRALIMAQIAIAKAEADFPALTRLSAELRDCQKRFG